MIFTSQSAIAEDQHIPYQLVCDADFQVIGASKSLQLQAGLPAEPEPCPIDLLLQLDSNASRALRVAAESKDPVCFRASIRIREKSLLPVYWTVVPQNDRFHWYGFPATDRDRMSGRLRELELIVASFHDLVFELDRNGHFLNYWVRDPQMLFIPPAEFLGKHVDEVIHQFAGPLSGRIIDTRIKVISTKHSQQIDYQLDTDPRWFSCRITPLLSPEADIIGMLIIITDISNQHKLENSLRESEERHRDLFENANDIIYIIDIDSTILSMNRKAEELLGYSEGEMLGKSSYQLFAPERVQEVIRQEYLKKSGHIRTTVYESDFIAKDGRRISVEISSRLIYRDGIAIGTHVTARDIRRQIRAQQELAKSEARYRFMSENARDVICLHQPDTRYLYVSSSIRTMLGYEPDDLIGKKPSDFFHPEDADEVNREASAALMEKRNPQSLRYRFLHKKGHYIWLETTAQPIVDHGELIYIQTINRDITERKEAEQLLVEKDRLSSALAHTSRLLLLDQPLNQLLAQCFPIFCSALQADFVFLFKLEEGLANDFMYWNQQAMRFVTGDNQLLAGAELLLSTQLAEYNLHQESVSARRHWMEKQGWPSILLAPVFTSEGCWGAVGCAQSTAGRKWTENLRNSFITFAASISSVLENHYRDNQLRQSEEWFRTLFRNSVDVVFVADAHGRLGYASPNLESNLGYKQNDLLGEYCRNLVHPEDRQTFNQSIQQLADNLQPEVVHPLRILHAKGHWCWMELKGQSKLDDPNIRGILLSFRDISEYIRIENTLKQYSDRITNVLHSITDGFIALDKNLRITMFNQVAMEAMPGNPHLAVGEDIWNLLPMARESDSFIYLNLALAENKTTRYEQYVESLNRWFDVSAFPFEEGMLIYFRDATEKKYQESLLQLEKELLEMNAVSTATLSSLAQVLLRRLDSLLRNTKSSIRLVKHNTREAVVLATQGLVPDYVAFVAQSQLDPMLSTAGQAVESRQAVSLTDIANSNLAELPKQYARNAGIHAVWSMPLISSTNEVLAVFSFYFTENRLPSSDEIMVVNRAMRIFTIIMENKQAAERLHISNERYLLATRAANEAIWDWDADEQVSYWGEGFKTIFGYPSEFYPGMSMNWENKIHPEDRDRVISSINRFTSGEVKGLFIEEYRFLKADGQYAFVRDKAYCLYDENGKVIRMIGSCEDITETKRLQEQLLQQEIHKQQQIAQAVVDVQESERAEIGKELHDNVNQLLSTAKLFLEVAENDASMQAQMISRSKDTIKNAINEIREISRSLMPASIGDLGLISSVNDLVDDVNLTKQVHASFEYDDNLDLLLPPKQQLMLFRIIQEQVNNILKHARATNLHIALSYDTKHTSLQITDDGIGFDLPSAKKKNGVGLSNIFSRAALFNGEVIVATSPGNGCELIIRVPHTLQKND